MAHNLGLDNMKTSKLTKRQRLKFGPKVYQENGETLKIIANLRYDDECGNGHNTFSITGDIYYKKGNGQWGDYGGGCIHDEIGKHFPELKPYLKWHLTSSDGPMHYIANTLYHASDKDCNGKRKHEPYAYRWTVKFADSPISNKISNKFNTFLQDRIGTGDFQVCSFAHEREPDTYSDNYSLVGFTEKWYEAPFNSLIEAQEFCEALNTCKVEFFKIPTQWSKGKDRDLDAARSSAVWPEATDAELISPNLKEKLESRHDSLMDEFYHAVVSLGLEY